MDKRNVPNEETMCNTFSRQVGAFELLEQMERGRCIECHENFGRPEVLIHTYRGYYNDGPILCAHCKAFRDEKLAKELREMEECDERD